MAVLTQYNFTTDTAPSTQHADVTGSTLVGGTLTTFISDTPGYASDPTMLCAPIAGATSAALAVTNDSYISLSITPINGKTISLTSLTFDIARGGAATPRGYDVRSNKTGTGYGTTLGTADITATRFTFQNVSIDLTGAEYQTVSDTVTLRIYLYAPSDLHNIDIDNITINGTTASGGTVDQEGFLWREDDGTEVTATSVAAQDTDIIRPKSSPVRLRVLLDSTLDRATESYQLEYRKVGDQTWNNIS